MSSKTQDLFEAIGEKLIAAIESDGAGKWSKPWQSIFSAQGTPVNATTKKAYQGVNVLVLWAAAMEAGYPEARWATYKQWQAAGAQVAKGQKGTKGVKWGVSYSCDTCKKKTGRKPCSQPEHNVRKHLWASSFTLFNVAQTEGYEAPEVDDLGPAPEKLEEVEAFIAATGANIEHVAGDRAYNESTSGRIVLPLREQFDTPEGYYGTALHELTHWSGNPGRLDRAQRNVFGSQAYAAEELVAEFGAAFLAAHFGVEVEPHIEHASYLKSWVSVIRSEPMALYRAAKQAQEAANWLLAEAGATTPAETPEAVATA
jgi:antirestriction protein ArdC